MRNRLIQAGWKIFYEFKVVLKSNIPLSLKRNPYNQCILQAMAYASETWTLINALEWRSAAAQGSIERAMTCVLSGSEAKPKFATSSTL